MHEALKPLNLPFSDKFHPYRTLETLHRSRSLLLVHFKNYLALQIVVIYHVSRVLVRNCHAGSSVESMCGMCNQHLQGENDTLDLRCQI